MLLLEYKRGLYSVYNVRPLVLRLSCIFISGVNPAESVNRSVNSRAIIACFSFSTLMRVALLNVKSPLSDTLCKGKGMISGFSSGRKHFTSIITKIIKYIPVVRNIRIIFNDMLFCLIFHLLQIYALRIFS